MLQNNKQEKNFESIKDIERKIDTERTIIKDLNNLRDEVAKLNKQVNRCIEMFSSSMQGTKINNILDEINDQNSVTHKKVSEELDFAIETSKRKINKLHLKKESINENIKEKYTIDDQNSLKQVKKHENS